MNRITLERKDINSKLIALNNLISYFKPLVRYRLVWNGFYRATRRELL